MKVVRVLVWFLVAVALAGAALLVVTLRLTSRAEANFPPLGKFVTVDGTRLHIVEKGAGPPIVLLHGAFGTLHDFTNTIFDDLARTHRVIAIDRPGHGHSERPAGEIDPADQARLIHGALRQLGMQRPILVGFSFGGAVVLAEALAHPGDVRAVVLLNAASHTWPNPISLTYRLSGLPVIGPVLNSTLATPIGHLLLDSSAAGVFAPGPVPPHFSRAALPLTVRPANFAANAEDIRVLQPFLAEQQKRYGELRLPLVIVVSPADRSVGADIHSRPLARAVPGAELIEVPGAGHPILYSHPEVALAAIARAEARSR